MENIYDDDNLNPKLTIGSLQIIPQSIFELDERFKYRYSLATLYSSAQQTNKVPLMRSVIFLGMTIID